MSKEVDMSEEVELFLKKIGALPLKELNNMTICHGVPDETTCKKEKRELVKKEIRHKVQKYSGVYIYTNESMEEVYYVGKAKELYERILCHYDESVFDERDYTDGRKGMYGDKYQGLYPAFFRDSIPAGNMTVLWLSIEDELIRVAIEALLTYKLKPKFLGFKKEWRAGNK